MRIPLYLEKSIEEIYSSFKEQSLAKARQNLTEKYKTTPRQSKKIIESKNESVLYALTRMPSTYVVAKTLLTELLNENLLHDISSAIDVGAGTGACYFALKEIFEDMPITLIEYDNNMISVLKQLAPEANVLNENILKLSLSQKNADLVISSYMLNELSEEDKLSAVKNMLDMTNKYLLLIDAGTPSSYQSMMNIKDFVYSKGHRVVAPCMTKTCTLADDYCQFFARVERTSLQRLSKSAILPFEDEKYFYLLIEKQPAENMTRDFDKSNKEDAEIGRVIRRPVYKPNIVELTICTSSGVKQTKVFANNKQLYRQAKKVKINQKIG